MNNMLESIKREAFAWWVAEPSLHVEFKSYILKHI